MSWNVLLKQAGEEGIYPNIVEILKVFLTMLVGSIACERSFSALRRLCTWLRNRCSQDRLNGLAMLHVHKDLVGDLNLFCNRILNRYDPTRSKRIFK